jgi:hypothetical protein
LGLFFSERRWRGTCQQVHPLAIRPRPRPKSILCLLLRACKCDSRACKLPWRPIRCHTTTSPLQRGCRSPADYLPNIYICPCSTCTATTPAPSTVPAHRSTDDRSVWPGTSHPSSPAQPALTVAASSDPCSCPLQIPRHSFLPFSLPNKTSHLTQPPSSTSHPHRVVAN